MIALKITVLKLLKQKSSLLVTSGKEERVLGFWIILPCRWFCHSRRLSSAVRVKPEFQPSQGYPFGHWSEHQHSCCSLPDYSSGWKRTQLPLCVCDLWTPSWNSGHPRGIRCWNDYYVVRVPKWKHLFPIFTPADPLIQIPTAVAFAILLPESKSGWPKSLTCKWFKSSLSSKNK